MLARLGVSRTVSTALMLSLPAALLLGAADPAALGTPDETPVERLIERLGHDDFEVREQATRELSARDDALPAVRRALGSPDAEVRRRAARIVEDLESRRARRLIQGTVGLANDGAVDEVVERVVVWKEADEKGVGGQAAVRLIDKLLELDRQQSRRQEWNSTIMAPVGNYGNYLKTVKPVVVSSRQVRVDKAGTYLV